MVEYAVETVPNCPLCGHGERRPLHTGLSDITLGAFPGAFDIVECAGCRSAYLASRPAPEALELAYGNYPTHDRPLAPELPGRASLPGRMRRAVTGAYREQRYRGLGGLGRGLLAAPLRAFPGRRREVDNIVRFLPSTPGRLLDYGSGGGAFLDVARSYGWEGEGVDFDEETLRVCREAGLRVTNVSNFDVEQHRQNFDAITLAHVLEHVPEPMELLATLYTMLKPRGHLYIELPNVSSIGHRLYRSAWRGLEVPRHFSLPTPKVLEDGLRRLGYRDIMFHPRRVVFDSIARESERAEAETGRPRQEGLRRARLRMQARLTKLGTEFLTVTASKPP